MQGFERVMGVVLEPEAWSVDNGLLTPTLKAKRRELLVGVLPVSYKGIISQFLLLSSMLLAGKIPASHRPALPENGWQG